MVPQVAAFEDLSFLHEEHDEESGRFQTTFALFNKDDVPYFGKSDLPKRGISLEQLAVALSAVPDEHVFPQWANDGVGLTRAPETLTPHLYVKRPNMTHYDLFQEHNVMRFIPQGLI